MCPHDSLSFGGRGAKDQPRLGTKLPFWVQNMAHIFQVSRLSLDHDRGHNLTGRSPVRSIIDTNFGPKDNGFPVASGMLPPRLLVRDTFYLDSIVSESNELGHRDRGGDNKYKRSSSNKSQIGISNSRPVCRPYDRLEQPVHKDENASFGDYVVNYSARTRQWTFQRNTFVGRSINTTDA